MRLPFFIAFVSIAKKKENCEKRTIVLILRTHHACISCVRLREKSLELIAVSRFLPRCTAIDLHLSSGSPVKPGGSLGRRRGVQSSAVPCLRCSLNCLTHH